MSNFLDKTGLQHYTEKVKAYVDSKSGGVNTDLTSHIGNKKNPHEVTKEQVGLGNVTNVAQIPLSQKGVASGVATLGTDGKLTAAQLPAMKTVNGVSVVGSGNISIDLSLYKVVDSLPTTGIDATKIYIVPAKTTGDKNIKAEYVYTGNPASTYDASKWEKLGEAQTNIVVDADLSATSTNPIQNKAVKSAIDALNTTVAGKLNKTDYVVDAELSATSTHPVQNKAVKSAVDSLTSSVNSKVATSTYNTKMTSLDSSISALQSKNTAQDSAIEKKLDKSAYIVDTELKATSKNPVQNQVVSEAFDGVNDMFLDTYTTIDAKSPLGIQATPGTAFAIVPNPTETKGVLSTDGWHGKELTFEATLFATKEGLDSCLKKTDMTAITNEEIDAMF
nr:MAG TPA: hypothetical protein [Crassvirales sp.]